MADIKSIGGNPIVLGMDGLGEDVIEEFDYKADIDGYYAQLTAGAADGIKGGGPTVDAAFLHRVTGDGQASDGPATIEVIRGNTLVWNQLVWYAYGSMSSATNTAISVDADNHVVSANAGSTNIWLGKNGVPVQTGHRYLIKGFLKSSVANTTAAYVPYYVRTTRIDGDAVNIVLTEADKYYSHSILVDVTQIDSSDNTALWRYLYYVDEGTAIALKDFQVFDLTQMFGAGNEPSTVAEFEALFPEPYYPYDAGSPLSVNMEGIETVGYNQWDEEWESGQFNTTTGEKVAASDRIRSKNYIPVIPSTAYYFECSTTSNAFTVCYYDADKGFIGAAYPSMNSVVTTPANARYLMFTPPVAYGTTYNNDICINLSWSGRRNGEYEPFWSSQRLIDVASYFPDDMRSAGSVYDELTESEAITRVGVVDLGTLTWFKASDASKQFIVGRSAFPDLEAWSDITKVGNIKCAKYTTVKYNDASAAYGNIDKTIAVGGTTNAIAVLDYAYENATAAEFKTAMSGVMLYYAVKTPTVTPIDPPLNLSYRAGQSGTETVLVPTGEMSAPVPMVVVYGSTPDGILDRSASLLAAADGPTATANHAIGSYLTMGGQLYRVTTAIASGEAIVPGTNVTATTVMAEVLSLIQ